MLNVVNPPPFSTENYPSPIGYQQPLAPPPSQFIPPGNYNYGQGSNSNEKNKKVFLILFIDQIFQYVYDFVEYGNFIK